MLEGARGKQDKARGQLLGAKLALLAVSEETGTSDRQPQELNLANNLKEAGSRLITGEPTKEDRGAETLILTM